MFKIKLALLLGIFPVAALAHLLLVWSSLGTDAAWPWIVNDLSYHLYVPFLLPAGLAALIPTRPWHTLSKVEGRTAWIGLLIMFVALSALGGLNDALTRADEPYFYRNVTRVLGEQQRIRQELKDAWNSGDATLDDKRQKGRAAYAMAKAQSQRWSAADVLHSAITVVSSAAIGAAFWVFGLTFFVGVKLRRQGKRLARTAADAMTLAMGLLILWFPARLYTEWHLHFYSLDQLHNFGMFFVVAFIALFALILLILLRFAWDLVGAVSGVSASLSAATGVVALVKPEALWYAWYVIESLPGVAWAIILTATAFMSILIARLAHAE